MRSRRRRPDLLAAAVLVGLWSVGPIATTLLTSLSTPLTASTGHSLIPSQFSVDQYLALFGVAPAMVGGVVRTEVPRAFTSGIVNSLILSGSSTLLVVTFAVTAGYALARLRFRFSRFILVVFLATLPVPSFVVVVPLFRIMSTLRLVDTYQGLVALMVAAYTPLAVWLFYSYARQLPVELEEAARVDGCSRLGAFVHVMLPNMRSGMAAIAAIVMLSTWGDFLGPLVFSNTKQPITVVIANFVGQYSTNYPLLTAAGMVAIVLPAVVAIALNRHIRGALGGWAR
jgi:multiple sugar transport system permease protein